MPTGSGISAQIMAAEEVTVGTAVTVTRAYEFNSESLSLSKNIVQGYGLRAGGQYGRSTRRAYTTRSAGGSIEMDLASRGMGMWFKHMLGSSTSALLSGSAYQQIHVPGSLTGKSLTIQKGVPQTDGTVKPFTYRGCKLPSWEISCDVGEIATLSVDVDAWDEVTATALATAAYTAGTEVFHFAEGSLLLGGTVSTASGLTSISGGTVAASVKSASVKGENPMANERYFLGSSGVKAEQQENDWRTVGGSLSCEFVNQATVYDLFAADTATALQLKFISPNAISGANYPTVEITIPSIRFDGETPQVGGPDIVEFDADFTGLDDGTNPAVQIRYLTSDTSI